VNVERRPTYQDWLTLVMQQPYRHIAVLANSDIFFDSTVERIQDYIEGPRTFIALSRWDQRGGDLVPHPNPQWSQDAWAFLSDAPTLQSLVDLTRIPLGVPRCDNKIAYLFSVFGFEVINPCREVRTIHVHETEQRSYDKKGDVAVLGGVAY